MGDLPSGTVTFLFSDVEGSTQLLERHPTAMGAALARHHEIFEELVAANHGAIFETVGDAVYAAFSRATDAAEVALAVQLALAAEDWGPIERLACRLALHTGEVEQRGDHYFGPALFRCARLQALGYGEQTLLSGVTADLVRHHLPEQASLQDLGIHRLKDLGEPEHFFALVHPDLRDTFPPPKSLDLHPNNLPLQLSSFVGREQELEQLTSLLRAHRLVTMTGTGGIGKTRLAMQLAANVLGGSVESAFFVDLAPLRQQAQIVPAIAAAIGLEASPGSSLEKAFAGYLGAQDALLVLDNAEQIPSAGRTVLGLLERSPGLRIVVTSRGPLHVRGEQVFALAPLATALELADGLPDPAMAPAIQLFAARAAEVDPTFTLTQENQAAVAAIVERLDGLPLAIELAAARVTVFDPKALLEQLDQRLSLLTGGAADLPERHQTLRATIDWSYRLLGQADRAAFTRLAVFAGGWTLGAAQAIAGADLETLTRLINSALIRRDAARFGMLEMIREYAAERFAKRADSEDTRKRHAAWYRDWAVRLQGGDHVRRDLRRPEELRSMGLERGNLDAAMTCLLDCSDGESALRLGSLIWFSWLNQGEARQGEAWLNRALELAPNPQGLDLAWVLVVISDLARFQGAVERVIPLKERAVRLALETGEPRSAAAALHDLTYLWTELKEYDKAEAAALRAIELRRKVGLPMGIAHGLDALGWLEVHRGNFPEGKDAYVESLAHARDSEDPGMIMGALMNVADVQRRLGETLAAAEANLESLGMLTQFERSEADPDGLQSMAELLTDVGRPEQAAELLGAASALRRRYGMEAGATDFNTARDRAKARLEPAEFHAAWSRGEALPREQAIRRAADAARELATRA